MKVKEIKRFSDKAFTAVSRLLTQLNDRSELPDKDYFKGLLKSERTHLFLAELDNKEIVGMLTIVSYDVPSGTRMWIEDVVVDEAQRGKGFGKALMEYALDYAESKGAGTIDLTSRPSRIEANRLYQKLGFVLRKTNVYRYLLK
jgi:ribosomal protein S18 acetylase RimI-like enzyme